MRNTKYDDLDDEADTEEQSDDFPDSSQDSSELQFTHGTLVQFGAFFTTLRVENFFQLAPTQYRLGRPYDGFFLRFSGWSSTSVRSVTVVTPERTVLCSIALAPPSRGEVVPLSMAVEPRSGFFSEAIIERYRLDGDNVCAFFHFLFYDLLSGHIAADICD